MTLLTQATLFLGGLGAVMMFLPIPLWWLLFGWYRKEKNPSDDLLVAFRLGGNALVITAMILLFFQ